MLSSQSEAALLLVVRGNLDTVHTRNLYSTITILQDMINMEVKSVYAMSLSPEGGLILKYVSCCIGHKATRT